MATEACAEDHDHEAELARLMEIPGALEAYHGWMHGFHGFPFEGCGMTDLGPHEGPEFEVGMERGRSDPRKPARDEAERRQRMNHDR